MEADGRKLKAILGYTVNSRPAYMGISLKNILITNVMWVVAPDSNPSIGRQRQVISYESDTSLVQSEFQDSCIMRETLSQ